MALSWADLMLIFAKLSLAFLWPWSEKSSKLKGQHEIRDQKRMYLVLQCFNLITSALNQTPWAYSVVDTEQHLWMNYYKLNLCSSLDHWRQTLVVAVLGSALIGNTRLLGDRLIRWFRNMIGEYLYSSLNTCQLAVVIMCWYLGGRHGCQRVHPNCQPLAEDELRKF